MSSSMENLKKQLTEAVKNNKPDDVRVLLKELNTLTNTIQTQFYEACKQGHLEVVKMLYNTGKINLEYKNSSNGYTPLIVSIFTEHYEVAKYLIEKGADIQTESTDENVGSNVLSFATESGNLEITELILNDKRISIKDINYLNLGKFSPLSYAITSKNYNNKIIKLLVEKGADINVIDKDGDTPLISAVYVNNTEIVTLLLEKGAKINHRNNEGQTALIYAVGNQNPILTKILIDNGANPLEKDNLGKSVLNYAQTSDMKKLVSSYINSQTQQPSQPEQPTQQPPQPPQPTQQPEQPTQQPSQPEQPIQLPIKNYIISITKEIQENPTIRFKPLLEKIKPTNPDISQIPIEKQFELFESIKAVYNK